MSGKLKWYLILSALIVIFILLMWIIFGRKSKAKVSIVTPILAAAQEFSPTLGKGRYGVASPRPTMPESPVGKGNYDMTPIVKITEKSENVHWGGRSSKYEEMTCRVAERVFGVKFQRNFRPDWLNPIPGSGRKHNLELDMYNEDIGLGIEYNGVQHYKFPNYFHGSDERGRQQFFKYREADEHKLRLCDEKGVYLITVPYNAHSTGKNAEEQIEGYLRAMHPNEEAKRVRARAYGRDVAYDEIIDDAELAALESRAVPTLNVRPSVVVTTHDLLNEEDYN